MIEALARLWCKSWHTATLWPSHGMYACATCHRRYPCFTPAVAPRDVALAGADSATVPATSEAR